MRWFGQNAFFICGVIVVLALLAYAIERLYVTPEEAITYSVHQILAATSEEEIDKLDLYLHDKFFENPPPSTLQRALRQYSSNSSDTFNRKQLRLTLRNFLEHVNVKYHYIRSQDISIDGDRATVKLKLLTFYNESDQKDRIDRKIPSKWTLQLTRSDGRWQVTNLMSQN